MDWYAEGVAFADRYWLGTREYYGFHPLSHRRVLSRLTPTSATQRDAEEGFYHRMREIADMDFEIYHEARSRGSF